MIYISHPRARGTSPAPGTHQLLLPGKIQTGMSLGETPTTEFPGKCLCKAGMGEGMMAVVGGEAFGCCIALSAPG